ncbi:MAG: hypothetical protein IPJ03_17575 [Ignavibacteriales bacterium]|nr:hypothetical protein [Ignavibacteriales bacterium]
MKRGSDFVIMFEAKNEYGGIIDLTSASIYFTLKADPDSTSILITKENTAGDGTLSTLIASGWTSNPTAAWNGTTLTITSSGSEFTDAMITDSTLTGQFVLTSQAAGSRVLDFNTTTGTYYIYVTEVAT